MLSCCCFLEDLAPLSNLCVFVLCAGRLQCWDIEKYAKKCSVSASPSDAALEEHRPVFWCAPQVSAMYAVTEGSDFVKVKASVSRCL